jgi:hypothetical protein
MRELLTKIGRFCERHVEKIVFILVVPVCAYLFFTRVIFSPNAVPYEGKMLNPGRIDAYVDEKANDLRDALAGVQRRPQPRQYVSLMSGPIEPNDPVVAGVFTSRPAPESFRDLFVDPLSFLSMADTTVRVMPTIGGRKYALPPVGPVTDVRVNHIRAAAYVPIGAVATAQAYNQANSELNDIDLVTVEAKFNVAELYRYFNAHFNGTEVAQAAWRDPCLAVPKFASVQVQRQERLGDGTWSDWVAVPRSRVEQFRELFTPIEKVEGLPPGGVKVRLMQLNSRPITMALLQPEAYQIASAEEDWLPPSFYDKFKTLQRKVELEERRKEREERQQEAATATSTRTTTTSTTSGRRGATTGGDTGVYGGDRRGGTRVTRGRDDTANDTRTATTRGARRGTTAAGGGPYEGAAGRGVDGQREVVSTDEAYLDYMEALITYTTDLSKLDKPMLFWAFDDTAEPGVTYRYRIRLGVLNPVAGTNELVERDMDKKDQVILWSRFSDVTPAVTIPRRLYFFAKDVQDRARAATVEVARYTLGYWYTQDFQVRPGEVIGREMEPPKKKEERRPSRQDDRITGPAGRGGAALLEQRMLDMQTVALDNPETPKTIDYGTNAMLVDLVETTDLGSPPNLQPRPYHNMLYTTDGTTIEHMPVNQRNWPADLVQAYQQIAGERNRDRQPFRAFRATRGRGTQGGRGDPYSGGLYGGG